MLDISKIVGQNVRRLRDERVWSGSYLAKIMDTTPQHVSGIEAGSRGLSEKQISKLCESFCCMFPLRIQGYFLFLFAVIRSFFTPLTLLFCLILEESYA